MVASLPLVFDWTRFSGGEAGIPFQRMAIALFANVHGPEGLTFGPTHTSRDGGNDAWYDGEIEGVRAHWKIACAVRKDVRTLLDKARDEHASGVRAGAEAILLCTPLDLSVDHVHDVEAVLGKGLRCGLVWSRSKLEHHLRNDRFFAAEHFGLQLLPGFVPLDSAAELELTTQLDLPLVGRQDALRDLEGFLRGPERVLLIVAPGGTGKSRFLRALAEVGRVVDRSPWLRRAGQGTIEDALVRGMPRQRPLLLCLDDAGLAMTEAVELACLATPLPGGVDAKVVLTARVPDGFLIEKECRAAKVTVRTLALAPLAQAPAEQIVAAEGPGFSAASTGALLRFSGGNLFLLRAAAQAVVQGERVSEIVREEDLRGLIVDRLIREAAHVLRPLGLNEDTVAKILLQTALDAPIPAKTALGDEHLAPLIDASILRVVGDGTRFRADVEGDLLLGHLTREPWAQAFLRQQLAQEPESTPHRLRNLAAAGDGYPARVVEQACHNWTATAARTTALARRKILKMLPHAATVAPQAASDLCRRYLTVASAPPKDKFERTLRIRPIATDDLGPILVALARSGHPVHALQLALDACAAGVPEGTYANYKLPSASYEHPGVIAEIASPAYSDPASIHTLLSHVEHWLIDVANLSHKARIIEALLQTMLARTFHWVSFDPTSFTPHERPFSTTPAVLELRGHAMTVLECMFDHADAAIRLAAARVFGEHGRGGGMVAGDANLGPVVEAEAAHLIPVLERRLERESDFAVLSEIERALIVRWAAQLPHGDACGTLLRGRARPPLYRAYQFVERKSLNWRFDPDELWNQAPSTDRWKWWVALQTRTMFGGPPPDLTALIDALRAQYADAPSLASALRALGTTALIDALRAQYADAPSLASALRALDTHDRIFLLLDPWCMAALPLFQALRELSALEPEIRCVAMRVVRRTEYRNDSSRILRELEASIAGADLREIDELLADGGFLPLETRFAVASLLVADPRVSVRARGLDKFSWASTAPVEQQLTLLVSALRDGAWRPHWELVYRFLQHDALCAQLEANPAWLTLITQRLTEAILSDPADDDSMTTHDLNATVDQLYGSSAAARLTFVEVSLAAPGASVRDLGPLLAPLLRDGPQLEAVAAALSRWLESGLLARVPAVIDLLETGLAASNLQETAPEDRDLPPQALALGRTLLKDAKPHTRVVGVLLLSELRGSAEACVEVAEACAGDDPAAAEAAARAIHHFSRPRGAYGWTTGELPPALTQINRKLEVAETMARTNGARAVIIRLQEAIADELARHARRDEELLDPHRA